MARLGYATISRKHSSICVNRRSKLNYDPTPEELEALKRQHEGMYVYAPTPEALAEYRAWALKQLREAAGE